MERKREKDREFMLDFIKRNSKLSKPSIIRHLQAIGFKYGVIRNMYLRIRNGDDGKHKPMFHRSHKEIRELRERIFKIISENPGDRRYNSIARKAKCHPITAKKNLRLYDLKQLRLLNKTE